MDTGTYVCMCVYISAKSRIRAKRTLEREIMFYSILETQVLIDICKYKVKQPDVTSTHLFIFPFSYPKSILPPPLANMVAPSHERLLKFKLRVKIQFLSDSSYISSSRKSYVVSGHHMGQYRYCTFPSQKVLLDTEERGGCPAKTVTSQSPLRYGQ